MTPGDRIAELEAALAAERDAAADLAREECAKWCEDHAFGDPKHNFVMHHAAKAFRSTIADPESVRRTMEDAARFRSLPKWMSAICWNAASALPPLGHLKHGFSLDDLRAWLDDANAARKGEEGK